VDYAAVPISLDHACPSSGHSTADASISAATYRSM
jgi:hypothetical protein